MRWQYILQQVVLLGAWCWALWVVWREVRGLTHDQRNS